MSNATTRAIFGANRSGKTTAGGLEFLMHVTGLYPEWYPDENKIPQPAIGRIFGEDFEKGLGKVIVPFLEEWLDPSLVTKKKRNPVGIPTDWGLKNGSRFDIMTYKQDTAQCEGWKGHVAWFDEPPPRDKYIATRRGLIDFDGRDWMTLTPLTEPWIYDDIYAKADGKDIFAVTVDISDNPFLNKKAVKKWEQQLTEDEKAARLHGKFLHLSGLIYKEFDPQIHICEQPDIKKDWTTYFCVDPHPRTPTACLWLAVDPQDNHWIYDELWLADVDLEQLAHAIHVQEGDRIPRYRFIDPAMDNKNALAGGFNVRKELMKYGIYTVRANTDKDLGRRRIQKALKPHYNPLYKTETPQLRVARQCEQTIFEFQHYQWADRKRNKENLNPREKPKKANDHFMDALRYLYNFGPRYDNTTEEDEDVVTYEGEYTRHPVVKKSGHSKYRDLVSDAKF